MKYYTKDQFKQMPWKNGAGITTELYRLSKNDQNEEFNFRLSMAFVQSSGPFSEFPGLDRILILLKGKGFVLLSQKKELKRLTNPFETFSFPGESKIDCELLGDECLDFNIMTSREWGSSAVSIKSVNKGESQSFQSDQTLFLFFYKSDPELIELCSNENFSFTASEAMTVISIEVKRKDD